MSDFENPYQSPESQIVPETKPKSGIEITNTMLNYLYEASPWLRFVGILGYIGAGFTIFSGIISTISVNALGSAFDFAGLGEGFGAIFAVYIPIGIIMFFPAHFIFLFGQKIKSYRLTNSIEDLEQALKNNKSYWKFMGILYIVSLAATPFLIMLAVIVGVAGILGGF